MFDIDLTDYDDVRTCGREGHICTRCWPLMAVAVQARRWQGWSSQYKWPWPLQKQQQALRSLARSAATLCKPDSPCTLNGSTQRRKVMLFIIIDC